MSSQPEFPPHAGFIRAVSISCNKVRVGANVVINEDGVKRLLTSPAFTTAFTRLRTAHGYKLPLVFPSTLAELNLLATLSILNFGSGYRVPLHAATGRGAFDSIRALVFALYISATGAGEGDYLSAQGMRSVGAHIIADLMGLADKIHVERAHESIPGLTVGELGGPLWELVQLVTRTLNDTGAALVQGGYPDLGSFLLEALREGERAQAHGGTAEGGADIMCDVALERLVRFLPAFRDMAIVGGEPVYCFKKALLTLHAVALRFSTTDARVPVPRTAALPVFVDNVLPSLLVHLGVIDLSAARFGLAGVFGDAGSAARVEVLLAAAATRGSEAKEERRAVPKEGPVLSEEQAYVLRAAAVDACEAIVQAAHKLGKAMGTDGAWLCDMTLPELDAWLWAVAKDRPDYRKLERFVLRDTTYF
ncbi:predicted protein [Postia placenta Mad-698-R]|uniref:Queuosine 5'-phosphate N-glycosylase/hydrolase n=1 Tax=Rhodonia placenta TaxID=104341 RepID=A0A8H7NYB7_9APHY|nr:predicted protein [Postia placenta Mad-698-R]KAF9809727.1 hypothetical protein IEO21_07294 [Postia placenta]